MGADYSQERKTQRVFPVDRSTMLPRGNGEMGWLPVSLVPCVVFWLPGLFWQPVMQAWQLGSVLSMPRAAGKQFWAPQGAPKQADTLTSQPAP